MGAFEKHYSVGELAELWNTHPEVVRRIFRNRPDVLKLNSPEKLRKRSYCVLRIPASVAARVYEQLRAETGYEKLRRTA